MSRCRPTCTASAADRGRGRYYEEGDLFSVAKPQPLTEDSQKKIKNVKTVYGFELKSIGCGAIVLMVLQGRDILFLCCSHFV